MIICPIIRRLAERFIKKSQGDATVKAITTKMEKRAEMGFIKYRQTLARRDLTRLGWLKHAQEEVLDLIAYLEAHDHHHGEYEALRCMQEQAFVMATILESEIQKLS